MRPPGFEPGSSPWKGEILPLYHRRNNSLYSLFLVIYLTLLGVVFFGVCMNGKLIVFEGTDASGKATQQHLLIEALQARGFKAEALDFPRYSKFFGSLVGRYLNGEFGLMKELSEEFCALLYSLDRYQMKKEIEQKLASGTILVSNRYVFSNIAFQTAKFHDAKEKAKFQKWIETVESRMPKPGLVFLLDLPIQSTVSLMAGEDRQKDYRGGKERDIHESNEAYLERVRQNFLKLAKRNKNWRVINCEGKKGILPKQEIASLVLKETEKILW